MTFKYKDYVGKINDFDAETGYFHGEVIGLKKAGMTFQGRTVQELQEELKNSVEDYLAWCREDNMIPEKGYSGKILLRVTPDEHAEVAEKAAMHGISLNKYIAEKIRK